MKNIIKIFSVLGLMSLAGLAQADPLVCNDGDYAGSLSTSDVTWSYDGATQDADNCYGEVAGNDDATAVDGAFGGTWEELAKADGSTLPSDTGSYMGVDFTLTATCDGGCAGSSGTYTLTWTDPAPTSLPLTFDFVVALKGSDNYGLYFFDDVTIQSDPNSGTANSGTGTWEITFLNNGEQIPNISHLTIYVREGTSDMPEPGTLSLLGIGLLGIGLSRRRKARA
jgi:hypothetical protein